MATNDLLLVDKLLDEYRASTNNPDIGSAFEAFALGHLLKNESLESEDIEEGVVDGKDDSGIDAWFIFVDEELVSEDETPQTVNRSPKVRILIATAKHHDTFRLAPVTNMCAALDELLNLTIPNGGLTSRYNEMLLSKREALRNVLLFCADKKPEISVHLSYVSRGDAAKISEDIAARAKRAVEIAEQHIDCSASFEFLGASELLAKCREIRDFSAKIAFEQSYVSRGKTNYLLLARLSDIAGLITDAKGDLKQHLFDSNIRDFTGRTTFVNGQIASTLRGAKTSQTEDFWWLNNGLTMIASNANIVGNELFLTNIQIVNGLQTTHSIFHHFKSGSADPADDRCVLVKVLITSNQELSDRIILATNSQEKVDSSSLRATDKLQRDIEQFLCTWIAADAGHTDAAAPSSASAGAMWWLISPVVLPSRAASNA